MQKNTFRKSLVIGIIILFIGAGVVSALNVNLAYESKPMNRGWLYVGGNEPGNYTTIQSAIDAANPGDTVFVYNGTYYENLVINKDSISIIGENKTTTIIDTIGSIYGVEIPENCDNNYFSNFTVLNASIFGFILHSETANSGAECNYNTISNCIVRECNGEPGAGAGIVISAARWSNQAKYNMVIDCEIFNNDKPGIIIDQGDYTAHTEFNQILNSKIYNNSIGILLDNGLDGGYVSNNIISNCQITNNTNYGIKINNSVNNNYLDNNNFINNGQNANDNGVNTWYNTTLQEGNYWDDYTGKDNNGDGIGDTPYNLSGGSNQDLYPLMYPYYPTHPDTVYVDDDFNENITGWGYDKFNRIQYGINEIPKNGTVYVYSGTYLETYYGCDLNIIKSIKVVGEKKETTIIHGGNSYPYNSINFDSVVGVEFSGFTINNSFLSFGDYSDNCIIHDVLVNRDATYDSMCVYINAYSDNNIFYDNVFNHAEQPVRIYWDGSTNNLFYHNNFFNNTYPPYDYGSGNYFYNSTLKEGNYYDDYTGVDNNGDGIGDTPYNISGGSNQDLYPFMRPNGWINYPPNKPSRPFGLIHGKIGIKYTYTTITTDPDGDQVYYKWDWGDGSFSDWLGPNNSGVEVSASHSWSNGSFEIKVKAKDTYGAESDWSEPLLVTMPKNKAFNFYYNLLEWLFERYSNLFPILHKIILRSGLH